MVVICTFTCTLYYKKQLYDYFLNMYPLGSKFMYPNGLNTQHSMCRQFCKYEFFK